MLKSLPTRPRNLTKDGDRIAIVASSYNSELVEPMVACATEEIRAIEPLAKVEVLHAPGSFEIPFLTRQVIDQRKPDAVICIGVILRGETAHADLIAGSVSDTLCMLSVRTGTPVIHAVLLLGDEEQARERCLGKERNRGIEAARAAITVLQSARTITPR